MCSSETLTNARSQSFEIDRQLRTKHKQSASVAHNLASAGSQLVYKNLDIIVVFLFAVTK